MKYTRFVFVCIAALLAIQTSQALTVETMDNYNTKINLSRPSYGYSSSISFKSHRGSLGYTTNRAKTMFISAPLGYGLFAAVKLLDLRPNAQDYLSIIGGKDVSITYSNRFSIQDKHIYYDENFHTMYTSEGQINVSFVTGPSTFSYGYGGFEIIFTVQDSKRNCASSYNYLCDNGRCIASVLKCDGHNHCGDRSDQKYCDIYITPGRRTGWIIGGVFFAMIGLICGIYIMMRKLGRRSTTETVISHPPPNSYPPPYPVQPSYPQGYPAPPPPYSQSQGINNPGYH